MFNCFSCGETSSPGEPMAKRAVLRPDGSILREDPLCSACAKRETGTLVRSATGELVRAVPAPPIRATLLCDVCCRPAEDGQITASDILCPEHARPPKETSRDPKC